MVTFSGAADFALADELSPDFLLHDKNPSAARAAMLVKANFKTDFFI